MTILRLDYETRSELDLPKVGLDRYTSHPSTIVTLAAYRFDEDKVQQWDYSDGEPFPKELKEALADPIVQKRAFNAQFERVVTKRVLKINTPYENWRCTMVLAYMMSFAGTLGDIGKQIGLPQDKQKQDIGKKLIKLFCCPHKPTKANPYVWRDCITDPTEWQDFKDYNRQDVIAEEAIERRLINFPVPDDEWALYELDQWSNDYGIPIDMRFVENAIWMAARRKSELLDELREVTELSNPNSVAQLLPWVRQRGYPFEDLQKDTVKKVLREHKAAVSADQGGILDLDAVDALELRLQASRTSTAKYDKIKSLVGDDGRLRFQLQFFGAQRTGRWGGRGIQPHNLARTPKSLEDLAWLSLVTDAIRDGDYDLLTMLMGEPMDALAGCVRSAIRADDGREFRVADLASIESCVIGWLTECERLLDVFRSGRCAYKDFATVLYNKPYEQITKGERTNAKPAVLGGGYRLGGGVMTEEGKKTGLWAYAENMCVFLTQEQSKEAVRVFRENYHEIVQFWYDLERAVEKTLKTGVSQKVGVLKFEYRRPFLTVKLPSGRHLYYFQPRIEPETMIGTNGEPYTKMSITYMGWEQTSKKWLRMHTHGGKLVENFVQAIARDVLKYGLLASRNAGFDIPLHVHDEIVTEADCDDDTHTLDALKECMTEALPWAKGLPLGAAGFSNQFYCKD